MNTWESLFQLESSPAVADRPMFDNPFEIEDIAVFDDETLRRLVSNQGFGLTLENLALSLHAASEPLVARVLKTLPGSQQPLFKREVQCLHTWTQVQAARRQVLDNLFWELTYWKTPNLYEELTEGEYLHPEIFPRLERDLRGKIVLDAGAGSGRASFECLRYGAEMVHAMEPSPGLLRILKRKLSHQPSPIQVLQGRFDAVPLADRSVDITLSCSAFTSQREQGGEPGLAELKRVTRPGGKIILIWTRPEDQFWLAEQGFQNVSLPVSQEMGVRFRSLHSARRCARRFYARNRAVMHYLFYRRQPVVPFAVLGYKPPCDYSWLTIE